MTKHWILTILAVAALVQIATSRDVGEVLDDVIRRQLSLYNNFEKEAESANHADDLKKLIKLYEEALKNESVDEKNKIISTAYTQFKDDFNQWIVTKIEESNVNNDINHVITFYNYLLSKETGHENEINKTLNYLKTILEETDLKEKIAKFLSVDKDFSPGFKQFLKENSLPVLNQNLQETVRFFEILLEDEKIQFAQEIKELKAKALAALDEKVSVDDKNKALQEISNTENQELNAFLQKKHIELL